MSGGLDDPVRAEEVKEVKRDLGRYFFYHAMEVPGIGLVPGHWDLRPCADRYLGRIELAGRRVLEIGPANGFLTFHMESRGASVVGYDLSPDDSWDTVPYAGRDGTEEERQRREQIGRLNAAFLMVREAMGMRAELVHGSVYDLPASLGRFDVCVLGSVLLHLRDPFLALERALALTDRTVVVTDMLSRRSVLQRSGLWRLVPRGLRLPSLRFLPDHRTRRPGDTWWLLSPEVVSRFIGVLGFDTVRVDLHGADLDGRRTPLFTVVGERRRGPGGVS